VAKYQGLSKGEITHRKWTDWKEELRSISFRVGRKRKIAHIATLGRKAFISLWFVLICFLFGTAGGARLINAKT
jgi:hypothetical protein